MIVQCYKNLKQSTIRQIRLRDLFVKRRDISCIKIKLDVATIKDMTSFIDIFEKREAIIHKISDRFESLFCSQLNK